MRTLGQVRAEFALNKVIEFTDNLTPKEKKEFKSFTAGIPSMILQNGFGQSLAFMLAKVDKKHKEKDKNINTFLIIKSWLSKGNEPFVTPAETERQFMLNISLLEQDKYLTAQKEALALLEWVKRFAAMEAPGGEE